MEILTRPWLTDYYDCLLFIHIRTLDLSATVDLSQHIPKDRVDPTPIEIPISMTANSSFSSSSKAISCRVTIAQEQRLAGVAA